MVLGAFGDVVDEPLPIEPLELPVLGVLGEVLELPDELPLMPDELLVPPLELEEPDLLKWASHSAREIWPSLLVSTDAKLGVEPADELALGALDEPELAEGDLVVLDEESAATARVDRAKSAAAVVTVTVLSISELL